MMADPGTVPIRTRTADEIAGEIVKLIKEGKDPILLAEVVKTTLDLLDGSAFLETRRQLETYVSRTSI
jgi:hypothetical protein